MSGRWLGFWERAGSYKTVNMAEKRGHPSDAAETSSEPTTLPTGSSHAGDIILTTTGLQEITLEDPTRYAAHKRSPAVSPTLSGPSTLRCSQLSPPLDKLQLQRGTCTPIEILTNTTHSGIRRPLLVSVQGAPSGTRSSRNLDRLKNPGRQNEPLTHVSSLLPWYTP